jgi:uncharacterized repeat protein (TIGR03803 family)
MATEQSFTEFSGFVRNAVVWLPLLLLAACGGGGGSNSNSASLQAIAITPTNPGQQLGKTRQLIAMGAYSDGTMRDVSSTATWSSSTTSVATVNAAGLVSTVAIGSSTITATLNGVHGSATMMVTAGPAIESILYRFGTTPSDGVQPIGPIIQATDGNFYGTTGAGGAYSCLSQPNFSGTVYKVTPAGVETVLHSFGGSASDGWKPAGSLIQASDGNFYGTTTSGGNFGAGTVFKITPDGVETVLYSFGASPADGTTPNGSLVQAGDGNFYGTTAAGGANSCAGVAGICGTVFKITSASDGWQPGPLIQASDGDFYGTTTVGGTNSCAGYSNFCGTVFKITPAGAETVLYSFGASLSDGAAPQGPLIQGSDGNFYGTTASGGNPVSNGANICTSGVGCGTIFKITPTGVETVLYAFAASASDGNGPTPFLIQASDGNFYGTTYTGGTYDVGTAFQVTPAGVETILYSFGASASDGSDPTESLIQASGRTRCDWLAIYPAIHG